MKAIVSAILLALATAGLAHAEGDCAARAAEKKLAGAAKNSFMKKCEADAKGPATACEARAKEKKLAGAAKNSFLKKCVADGGPANP